jgi:hypothetical protein
VIAMKKKIVIVGTILTFFFILFVAFLYEMNRQDDLAMQVAVNFVNKTLKDKKKLKEYNIPLKVLNAKAKLVDTNHYFSNWQFIFATQETNSIELIVKPEKSIGIIPLFNNEKELKVIDFNYLK